MNPRIEFGRRVRKALTDAVRIAVSVISSLLSVVLKRFCEFGCAEDVCDAFQVVGYRRKTHYDLGTGRPAHQLPWMSEDAVLIVA
jgi:hypothetical protein